MNILNTYNEFDTNNFDLNVDHYGSENCDKDYSFGPSIRDNFVLHFITAGRGTFSVKGQETQLQAGDLFILPKGVSTFYQADEKDPWSYIWIGFSGSKVEGILKQSRLCQTYYLHSHLGSKILGQLLQIIKFSNQKLTAANELLLTGELYKLLGYLVAEFPNKEVLGNSETLAKTYTRQAIKLIHSLYGGPLKITDIAEKLSLNRSYLYTIFKQQTGYSLKKYLIHIRMQKSLDLLKNPDISIAEISNSVGYTDPLTFSSAFKKYYGISPSLYRQEQEQA